MNLHRVGVDEERDVNVARLEPLHDPAHRRLVGDDVQAALGRQFLAAFRHQRRLVRLDLAGQVRDGVHRRHFQVQPVGHQRPQQPQVALLDVAPVFAQVDGDAVGPAEQSQQRRRHGVGFVGRAALAAA